MEEVQENNDYLSILKSNLNNKGITDKEIKNKSESLKNIIKYYINIINNLEKNQYYIDSRANLFFADLEKKFIIAKDMTEKQYSEKIRQFIKELQLIFKLLQHKSINKKIINMTDLKEKREKKLAEIYQHYEEGQKFIKEKIDGTFMMIIKSIDDIIKLGYDNDISSFKLEQLCKELDTIYRNELKKLDELIKDYFFKLQYKLDNKINESIATLVLFGDNCNEKHNLFISYIDIYRNSANKFVLHGLFPVLDLILNILALTDEILKLRLFKTKIIERLKKARKEIVIQWDSFYFKNYKILIKTINEAYKNMMIVYETQMTEFNEKTTQSLFEQFIKVIGDKNED